MKTSPLDPKFTTHGIRYYSLSCTTHSLSYPLLPGSPPLSLSHFPSWIIFVPHWRHMATSGAASPRQHGGPSSQQDRADLHGGGKSCTFSQLETAVAGPVPSLGVAAMGARPPSPYAVMIGAQPPSVSAVMTWSNPLSQQIREHHMTTKKHTCGLTGPWGCRTTCYPPRRSTNPWHGV